MIIGSEDDDREFFSMVEQHLSLPATIVIEEHCTGSRDFWNEVIPQEVQAVIKSVSESLVGELQRSLDFYTTTSMGEAESAVITPCWPWLTCSAYFPAFWGTSQVERERSGLMRVQLLPRSRVCHTAFEV